MTTVDVATNNRLVSVKGNDVFTNSLIIAEGTGNKHKNVKELIYKYENDMKDLGTLSVLNGESKGGRPEQYYILNEEQALFAITLLRNSKMVVAFKKELSKQFVLMRKLLAERSSPLFLELREAGKRIRRRETDVIKEFVEYARANGSLHPEWYYKAFTDLTNRACGISTRKEADACTEEKLQTAESIAAEKIRSGIAKARHYKDIYRDCKEALQIVFG